MSMATAIIESTRAADGDRRVALRDVGWKGYLTLLRLRGERPTPRMVYLDGTVWLMSPTFPHERLKTRLDQFVTEVLVCLRIPYIPTASTTFRRQAKRGGIEGDQTYYIANEGRIRGKDRIHLRTDPPPDLAIEAVHSHDARQAIEVYRRFRVPEVWICDETELVILVLHPNGQYARSPTSATFPFLSAAEAYDWMRRPQTESELEWVDAMRRWVRRTLKPRVRRPAKGSG
ncbi:MAG: Uma2 family endonuclease [Isosphaeraceae bacterium]